MSGRWKRNGSGLALLLVLFCCSLLKSAHAVGQETTVYSKTVLVIHSYHKGMQWVEDLQTGIEAVLLEAMGDSVDIRVEYMDTKRYGGEKYFLLLEETWSHKYKDSPPDCIVVCDDNGLNFLLTIRQRVFPGVPVVFCGINVYDPARFDALENITGVVEAYDLEGTLRIIHELLPFYRRVFVVNDDTTTGRLNRQRLERVQYDFADAFTFIYAGVQSLAELQHSLANLSDDTAVLLMSFNRDADGRVLRYRDAIAAARSVSKGPIFGVWSFYLGRGIVGGSLVDGREQGQAAGKLCLQILQGVSAADLPVITESPNRPMFDYLELERFRISPASLPPGSVIINQPLSLWDSHRPLILGGFCFFTIQGAIILFLLKNISRRRRSESLLRKSRKDLAVTLAAIDECVISVDRYGHIVWNNGRGSAILGREEAELLNHDLLRLLEQLDPVAGPHLGSLLTGCLEDGHRRELGTDFSLVCGDKRERRFTGGISPIHNGNGMVVGAVLHLNDITEYEKLQSMLVHSQKMEAIGQLAGGVAHDFNNLLTGISGFAELLSLQLDDAPEKRENALRIVQAAGRARDLTRQLLSFARKGRIVSSVIDCHQALDNAIRLLERSLDKNIRLVRELNARRSTIAGDPVQLENVFLNLAINGSDAMPDGGELYFGTENVIVDTPIPAVGGKKIEAGEYLQVTIRDTGTGMTAEQQQGAFEPFYTTKEVGKGTGLGLASVYGAMQEHGGQILLRSTVGKGTEFQLFFALSEKEPHSGRDVGQITGYRRARETVLVIDDEKLVLASAKQLLRQLGYTVITAGSAREGVELYTEHTERGETVDLVLLDMIMPEIDGATCFEMLRNVDPEVRVVICSGFAKTVRVRAVEALGAVGFLQKPFTVSEVDGVLRQVFDS